MNYIVLDLEWNQGVSTKPVPGQPLTFEIIEIGAVKLSADRLMTGEFSELVKPQVFKTMHFMTEKIIHLKMRELKNERPFPEVIEHFLEWCGPDPVFCTWGPLDLYELQRNMDYYKIKPLADGPFAFYDVQKLFALEYEENNKRVALETAVDMLKIEKDIPFHRAFSDAYYAAKVFSMIKRDDTLRHYSYDVFTPPKNKKAELSLFFGNYDKYISRTFNTKEDLINDKTVKNCNCYICNSRAKRIVKFFSPTGKYFLGLSKCDTHGYIKIKVRIRKSEDGRYFTVKTRKIIPENDAIDIIARAERFKKNKERIKNERR
jgi:DNA polymerase III epsilon subunit-like protein